MREEEEGKEEEESDKFDGLIQMVLRDLGDDGRKNEGLLLVSLKVENIKVIVGALITL